MTSVRYNRPPFPLLGLFVAAYLVTAGFVKLVAFAPFTGLSIWPPSGFFVATLVYSRRTSWPWWIIGGLSSELVANALWLHNPVPAMILIYICKASEAAGGAWLIRRTCGWPVRMISFPHTLAIVVVGAGFGPIITATIGSAVLSQFNMQSFASIWPLWWIGDATGFLLPAATALVLFNGWRTKPSLSVRRWLEIFVFVLVGLGVAVLSFRGHLATASMVTLAALIVAAFTLHQREVKQLMDTVPALIWQLSVDGEPIFFNKHMVDYLGLGIGNFDLFSVSPLTVFTNMLVHPDDRERVSDAFNFSLANGESLFLMYRMQRVGGNYRWIVSRAEPMRGPDGRIIQWCGVSLDVDEQMSSRYKLNVVKEKLSRVNHAASLAELSKFIAHELGQPLTALASNADACQRWLSVQPTNVERARLAVERIIASTKSAAEVVNRLRIPLRYGETSRNSVALDDLLAETRGLMAEDAARRHVHIAVEADSDIPSSVCDRNQIQQVLISLIRRSMEAMESVRGKRLVTIRVLRIGGEIQIEICDCGPGTEHADKIFEPFFQTDRQWTGMELAVCRSIVECHGGRLWAESGVNEGSKFIFTLPVL